WVNLRERDASSSLHACILSRTCFSLAGSICCAPFVSDDDTEPFDISSTAAFEISHAVCGRSTAAVLLAAPTVVSAMTSSKCPWDMGVVGRRSARGPANNDGCDPLLLPQAARRLHRRRRRRRRFGRSRGRAR